MAGHVYHLQLRLGIGKSSFSGRWHPVSIDDLFRKAFGFVWFCLVTWAQCIYRNSHPARKRIQKIMEIPPMISRSIAG
jgi:hypothetical protein